MLQARVAGLHEERERLLAKLGLVKREKPSARNIFPKQVAYACARMRELLLDPTLGHGRQLMTLLVSEIRVGKTDICLTGSNATLANAVTEMKMGTPIEEVPMFISDWRARHDSNVRPLPSEGNTLSS